ncbi:MAG TPA: hypothetical protein VGX51_08340 [Solirubrobacteraceae bacterium]|nr:hypothetical protein [Solirubrobacteraceae bacterium]
MRSRAILIAVLLATVAVPSTARAAKPVSYPEVLAQIEHGPLIRAVINRRLSHVEIKFRDLSEWEAVYPAGAQPLLQRLLNQRHIHVIFASSHHAKATPKPVHHHLRYIAAGVLGALALAGVAWLLIRRRRSSPPLHRDAPAS